MIMNSNLINLAKISDTDIPRLIDNLSDSESITLSLGKLKMYCTAKPNDIANYQYVLSDDTLEIKPTIKKKLIVLDRINISNQNQLVKFENCVFLRSTTFVCSDGTQLIFSNCIFVRELSISDAKLGSLKLNLCSFLSRIVLQSLNIENGNLVFSNNKFIESYINRKQIIFSNVKCIDMKVELNKNTLTFSKVNVTGCFKLIIISLDKHNRLIFHELNTNLKQTEIKGFKKLINKKLKNIVTSKKTGKVHMNSLKFLYDLSKQDKYKNKFFLKMNYYFIKHNNTNGNIYNFFVGRGLHYFTSPGRILWQMSLFLLMFWGIYLLNPHLLKLNGTTLSKLSTF